MTTIFEKLEVKIEKGKDLTAAKKKKEETYRIK